MKIRPKGGFFLVVNYYLLVAIYNSIFSPSFKTSLFELSDLFSLRLLFWPGTELLFFSSASFSSSFFKTSCRVSRSSDKLTSFFFLRESENLAGSFPAAWAKEIGSPVSLIKISLEGFEFSGLKFGVKVREVDAEKVLLCSRIFGKQSLQ